jgi:phage terminase Nu1 subunit (DNA packaging protein)
MLEQDDRTTTVVLTLGACNYVFRATSILFFEEIARQVHGIIPPSRQREFGHLLSHNLDIRRRYIASEQSRVNLLIDFNRGALRHLSTR